MHTHHTCTHITHYTHMHIHHTLHTCTHYTHIHTHHTQETGLLLQSSLSCGEDVRGKAVAFIYTSMFLSQFFTASVTGPIIEAYGSASAIMMISFLFSLLALPTIFLLVMRDTPTSLRSSSLGLRTVVRTVVGAVFRVIAR